MIFGVDQLLSEASSHKNMRFALATNDAARVAGDASVLSRVALHRAGLKIVRLFSGEHGIAAAAPDGEAVPDGTDPYTRLPVVSLYGATHRPSRQMLNDVDVVLFDIPDVGARFYTYIWTLSHLIEACAEAGRPLWVLDRPNPIGGNLADVEGPMLDEARFSTFVGRWRMPVRHSLTVGELARVWKAQRKIDVELRVFKAEGWRRGMHWPETGLAFTPPSPNMVSYLTALVYPGTCLIEGTNLSEGRGTAAPFRTFGAPWLDADSIVDAINVLRLPGLGARPVEFTPTASKWKDQVCRGVRLEITDVRALRPVAAGLHILAQILRRHPGQLEFRNQMAPNAPEGSHFDRLIGLAEVRAGLAGQAADLAGKIEEWTRVGDWDAQVRPHLLYS